MLLQNLSIIHLNLFVYLVSMVAIHIFSGYTLTNASVLYNNGNKNDLKNHDLLRNDGIENEKLKAFEFGSIVSKIIANSPTLEVTERNALTASQNKNTIKTGSSGTYEEVHKNDSKPFMTNNVITTKLPQFLNISKDAVNNIDFNLNSSTSKKTNEQLIRPLRHLHILSVKDFNTSILNASENLVIKKEQLVFAKDKADTKDTQSLISQKRSSKSEVVPYLERMNESFINTDPTIMLQDELTIAENESILEWNSTAVCENASTCNQTFLHAPAFNSHTLVKGVVLLNLGVLACIGNVATLGSIIRRGRQHSSTVYLLLVHLSISDLFVTSFCIVGEGLWTLTVEWYGGNLLCKVLKFLQMFSLYLSTFTLVVIGFDRLCAVKFPMRRIKARIQVHRAIIGAWLLSGVLSAPQITNLLFHGRAQ